MILIGSKFGLTIALLIPQALQLAPVPTPMCPTPQGQVVFHPHPPPPPPHPHLPTALLMRKALRLLVFATRAINLMPLEQAVFRSNTPSPSKIRWQT